MRTKFPSAAFALLAAFAASAHAQAKIEQIGFPLSTNTTFAPRTINNNGASAGYGIGFENSPALSWQDGHVLTIPLGAINYASALGINDQGQIVGYARNAVPADSHSASIESAFLFDGKKVTILSSTGPSSASAINNSGTIAGSVTTSDNFENAALWINGKLTVLDTSPGQESGTLALNNNGAAAGFVIPKPGVEPDTLPALWQAGKTITLGSLGGTYGRATGVNDSDIVVGSSENGKGQQFAFEWKAGKMMDLGVLSGDASSQAMAINQVGDVVGTSTMPDGYQNRAVLWQNDKILDLNTLLPTDSGWILTEADSINDKNQIVGLGEFDGHSTTFLLSLTSPSDLNAIPIDLIGDQSSAVPEPPAGLILFTAITIFSFAGRRRSIQ